MAKKPAKNARFRDEQPWERNIITYYFADTDEYFEITKARRKAKYPRSAVQRAVDNMSMNIFGAMVCVVYDDYFGEDHATITRSLDGEITVEYMRDQTAPEVSGTTKHPHGELVETVALKREKFVAVPTDEIIMQKLGIERDAS